MTSSYKSLRGRVTVVLTPELRQLALDHVREADEGEDLENLLKWFSKEETPDGYVLDASSCEAEAHMIVVISRAILWMYTEPQTTSLEDLDPHERDEEIRILTRLYPEVHR